MPSRARSSDGRGSLIVIEGMPGAGKTSAAAVLERRGHQVVGEYIAERPGVEDDEGHQRNWIAKAAIAALAMASDHVFCDRDFVTSLAFAVSIDDSDLLRERTTWALAHLAAGRLAVGDAYLVLDVTPGVSLARRTGRLSPEHAWCRPRHLERLRGFYQSPLDSLCRIDAALGEAFARAHWFFASGEATAPQQVAELAERLADQIARWPP